MIRSMIVLALLLVGAPATAQTAPRFHNSSDSPRYSTDDYRPVYREPLWRFTYYPNMPKAGERKYGHVYYPYAPYRSSYPADRYDRSKSRPYPVR